MNIDIQTCAACGEHFFPHRALCRRCGGSAFTATSAEQGEVERATALSDGSVIATVRTDVGPFVIARAEAPVEPGDVVRLTSHPELSPGQAFVPIRPANS
ncbi:zinc ribbon domain-containing protein [Leucobacter sp. USHLN153]|uniref:zinc ribbon domain-containing protein n=1 Tax=Leucobacter sp. USHLN153 TaxID=3081268 RepID=UPI00301614AF